MHDERTRLANDVEAELRQHFPELVFDTVIPRSVRVAEAPSFAIPVTEHAPGSRGSVAYSAISRASWPCASERTGSGSSEGKPTWSAPSWRSEQHEHSQPPRHGPGPRRDPAAAGRGDRADAPPRAAGADPAEPRAAAPTLRRRVDRLARRVASERRPDPAADRSPAHRRALRDHRRRAPLARGTRGRARDHSGRPSRRGRGASAWRWR